MTIFRSVLFCLILVSTLPTYASPQLYRCIDGEGNIEFQQTHCLSGKQSTLSIKVPRVGWVPPKVTKKVEKPTKRVTSKSTNAPAKKRRAQKKRDKSCWKAQQKLEQVENKLRRGYKASEGTRLHSRQERQESYLRKFC